MNSSSATPAGPVLPFVRDQRWLFDFALASLIYLISVVLADGSRTSQVLAALLTASLLVRRSHPRVALVWATAAAVLQAYYLSAPSFEIVVIPIIVYSVTRYSTPRVGLAALWLGLAGAVIGPARWTSPTSGNAVGFAITATACAAIVAGAYLLGRQLREQQSARRQRAQSEAERVRLLRAEQEQRARAVAMDERSRIARELHDIVAHSLSVIVVQAEGGRAVVLKKPEVGAQVLDTIADTGRTSLAEMRRIVDLLRGGGGPTTAYLPSPGLADLPELVHRSGSQFTLEVVGQAPPVPPVVGLTTYRVVQESITNVLKHAGPHASARVTITYTPSAIAVAVSDDGRGAAAHPPTGLVPGHGLRGMNERVALLRGTLSARPRPGGGFDVHVWIPVSATPPHRTS